MQEEQWSTSCPEHRLQCPGDRHLRDLVLGRLSDEIAETVESVFSDCETCAKRCGQLTLDDDFVRDLKADWTPPAAIRNSPGLVDTLTVRRAEGAGEIQSRATTEIVAGPNDSTAAKRDSSSTLFAMPRRIGEYELVEEIARGGMGIVYKANQTKLGRVVALKMIKSGHFAGPDDIRRFHIEAESAAALEHPNIVPIFDVGEEDSLHYFSMAYIDGRSLADRLADGPLACKQAAELVSKLAAAIAYAHEQGVIHRDLKPGNVLLAFDEDGRLDPRITDFGLAKQIAQEDGVTATGQILGTPSYMPPEQATIGHNTVGPLADVYSLGAILYCAVTARPPFQAASPVETLKLVLETEPLPPSRLNPSVDRDLETIILKCLEKEPDRRYDSATALADELQRYLVGRPIHARPIGRIAKAWRWCRRNRLATATIMLVALILVGSGGAMFWYQNRVYQDNLVEAERTAARDRRREHINREVRRSLDEAENWHDRLHEKLRDTRQALRLLSDVDDWESHVKSAQDALKRAESIAAGDAELLSDELRQRLRRSRTRMDSDTADWHFVKRQDEIRLSAMETSDGDMGWDQTIDQYEALLRQHGFDFRNSDVDQVAQKVLNSPIRVAVVSTIDFWSLALFVRLTDLIRQGKSGDALLKPVAMLPRAIRVASVADPAGWRRHISTNVQWTQKAAVSLAATKIDPERHSTNGVILVLHLMRYHKLDLKPFVDRLGTVLPENFWLNMMLGTYSDSFDDRAGYCRAALAVRPKSSVAWYNFGVALQKAGRSRRAIQAYETALRHKSRMPLALNNLSVACQSLGQFRRAEQACRRAIVFDRKMTSAWNNLGKTLERLNRFDEAEKALRQSIAINGQQTSPWITLGRLYRQRGLNEKAVQAFRKILQIDPRNATAWTGIGNISRDRGQLNKALTAYRKAVELNDKDGLALANLAHLKDRLGQFDEAMRMLRDAERVDPDCAQIWTVRGRIYAAHGKWRLAAAEARKSLEIDPTGGEAWEDLGKASMKCGRPVESLFAFNIAFLLDATSRGRYWFHIAGESIRNKGWSDAVSAYRKGLAILPRNADAWTSLSAALKRLKRPRESAAAARKAIAIDADHHVAWSNLGNALTEMKQLPEAVRALRKAIAANPNYSDAWYNLGVALVELRKHDEAITAYRKAIALNPRDSDAWGNLGVALEAVRKFDKAIESYRQAIKLNQKNANAWDNLGHCYSAKGQFEPAVKAFRQAIAINPKHANAWNNLGHTLFATKQFEAAVAAFDKAIGIDSEFDLPHGNRGRALLRLGRFREAEESFKRCVSLLPADDPFRKFIESRRLLNRRLEKLKNRLPVVLAGGKTTVTERLKLSQLCGDYLRRYRDAVRLTAEAFAEKPVLAETPPYRYRAIRCALLAAAKQGVASTSIGTREEAALRDRAFTWLRREVEMWRKLSTGKRAGQFQQFLKILRADNAFARVRETIHLEKLPKVERDKWRTFWKSLPRPMSEKH